MRPDPHDRPNPLLEPSSLDLIAAIEQAAELSTADPTALGLLCCGKSRDGWTARPQ